MRRIVAVFLLAIGLLLGRSAFGVVELIGPNVGDGGFESHSPSVFWTNTSNMGVNTSAQNPQLAHSGTGYLSLGNVNGVINVGTFEQITIPTNTILLQISYWWEMSDPLNINGTGGDPAGTAEFKPFVADSIDQPLQGGGIDIEFNAPGMQTVWRQVTVVSTNLAGQTIDLDFELDMLTNGAGANTSVSVDDVSVQAFTPADIPPNDFFTNSTVLNTTSNIIVFGTNILATREPGEPKIDGNNTGGHSLWWNWTAPRDGTVSMNTVGSTFTTLLGVFTGNIVSNLTPVAATSGNSVLRFNVSAGTTYQIGVDGRNGATGVVELNFSFSLDTTPPKVTITSPAANAKLTNSTVNIKGTASDNIAVASVQYRVENAQATNDFQTAVGTNTWNATDTNLVPGPNTIQVYSVDTSGNVSVTNSRTVTYVVVSPLTVNVSGTGTVSPNLNGQLEDVGADLTLTAKAGTGDVFSNWVSGDVVLATTTTLTIPMQSNLVVQANFVPNPFGPVVGAYQGLFYDTNGPAHESSGFFNVTLSSSGSYSAKVIVAGVNYSLSGQFSAGGVASNNIVRRGLPSVSVQMQLDLGGGGITGALSDGTWTGQLNADLIATSAGALAGHYTVIFPGADDPVAEPGGGGYATVSVSSAGGISLGGALSEGTKITQKANLTKNGQWAFYVPLYSGKGSIFGWLTFANDLLTDINGNVDWFKLAGASGKLYPGGFTNIGGIEGSLYQFTNNVPVLNLANNNNAWFQFLNGNLASGFINQVTLTNGNKIINNGTNKLTAAITTSSGLFKVTVADPSSGKSITANGVLYQKGNFGAGFFLGTNESGSVGLTPVSP